MINLINRRILPTFKLFVLFYHEIYNLLEQNGTAAIKEMIDYLLNKTSVQQPVWSCGLYLYESKVKNVLNFFIKDFYTLDD